MKVKEKKVKYIADGTIVTPKGFQAAGVHAGLHYTKKDLGVITSVDYPKLYIRLP
nr:hypothetical protein [Anoxybacillus flavithermus]